MIVLFLVPLGDVELGGTKGDWFRDGSARNAVIPVLV